jgi:proprotein convertase subtilisin/kexin type 5
VNCSGSTDHRTLNGSRCVPLPGYYETNISVAGQCPTNCLLCTSASDCTTCIARYGVNNSPPPVCAACPFDCYTCDSNSNCLSCEPNTDHRQLNGNRCVPLPGYYENNQTVAAACPTGCSTCSSATNCSACSDGYNLQSNQCVLNGSTSCPPRQYDYYGTCTACPYDCYTCNPSGYCLTCDGTNDHRQLSNNRCVPMAGYY